MIRNANLTDLDSIIDIEKQFGADGFSRSCLRRFIVLKKLFYMPDKGYYIILTRQNSNTARLYSIAVSSKFKRQGVGMALLAFAEQECKLEYMTLEVRASNMPAVELYKRAGFKTIKIIKNYYSDGESAFKMKKCLTYNP